MQVDCKIFEKAAALLVARGYAREWAEELLKSQNATGHSENAEQWVEEILSQEGNATAERREVLDEHHQGGIPPYEPPSRD